MFQKALLVLFFSCVRLPVHSQLQKAFGAQLGYTYAGIGKLEAGSNYYFSYQSQKLNTHTIGVYTALTGIFANDDYFIGEQIGMNYHYMPDWLLWPMALRISPSFENNFHHDMRVGTDFGISYMGFFIYAGYYAPIGSYESPLMTRWRFGLRFILNNAPLNAVGVE